MLESTRTSTTPTQPNLTVNPRPAGLTPITDANVHNAVDTWVTAPAAAEVTYGHIRWWDTSVVTDMSQLFMDKTTFDEVLSHW